jgi:hypothetical protein
VAHEPAKAKTILPLTILTVVDLGRLSRELTSLDDFSLQSSVRDPGKQPQLPRTSRGLEDLAGQSDLNLLVDDDRAKLKKLVDDLKQTAPVIHISFSADPSPAFMTKLVTWLRNEINPSILVSIGMQPSIAAGCIVRTPNKYFDFSLRKHLLDSGKLLIESLTEPVA